MSEATPTPFPLTTADPAFDPNQPVTVNGYAYARAPEPVDDDHQPAKENPMADTEADPWIGKYVVVRTREAGVHAGFLKSRQDRICELTESRRLWYWKVANNGAFLSGVATEGLDHKQSKVGAPIDILLTENCEIIACSEKAAQSIAQAPVYEAR